MLRKTLAVLGGALLSAVLLVIGSWLMLRLTSIGPIAEGAAGVSRTSEIQDPFDALNQFMWISNVLLFPVIALSVGAFVGLLVRNRTWQLAAASMVPAVLFFLAAHSWRVEAFLFGLAYLALASIAGVWIIKLRRKGGGPEVRAGDLDS